MITFSNTLLAFSMSADAFAAAVSKGVALRKPKLTEAMRIGLIFGIVETLTPLVGWLVGFAASGFIEAVDHWVAFVILGAIGIKMIVEGWRGEHKERKESHGIGVLVLTAFGTSIDAMAVGVTLALMDVNILVMAGLIGFATFVMATIGIMTGHLIGLKAGRGAEILGGLCLIAIGSHILLTHLSAI